MLKSQTAKSFLLFKHKTGVSTSSYLIPQECKWPNRRDHSIHIERECLAVFTIAKLGCSVKQTKIFLLLYYSKIRCSGSWLTL